MNFHINTEFDQNGYPYITTKAPGIIDSWITNLNHPNSNFNKELSFFYTLGTMGLKGSHCWNILTETEQYMVTVAYKGNMPNIAVLKGDIIFIGDFVVEAEGTTTKNVKYLCDLAELEFSDKVVYYHTEKSCVAKDNHNGNLYYLAFINQIGLICPGYPTVGRFWFDDGEIHRGFYSSSIFGNYVYYKNCIMKCEKDEYDNVIHFIRPKLISSKKYTIPGINKVN